MNLGGKDSQIPEGTKGTVLGPAPTVYQKEDFLWEVEYDNLPCKHYGRDMVPGVRSATSWFSRESRIELVRRQEAA